MGRANLDSFDNGTAMATKKKPDKDIKQRTTQFGLIVALLFVTVALFALAVFVFCYRRRMKKGSTSTEMLRQQGMYDIVTTPTLIPLDSRTPNQSDKTRTCPTLRRLSSSGSINSTTTLLHWYRTGSHRSPFSSMASSRIDSNIAEGNSFLLCPIASRESIKRLVSQTHTKIVFEKTSRSRNSYGKKHLM